MPIIATLWRRRFFQWLERNGSVSFSSICRELSSADQPCAAGVVQCTLKMLSMHGWLSQAGTGRDAFYKLRAEGKILSRIISSNEETFLTYNHIFSMLTSADQIAPNSNPSPELDVALLTEAVKTIRQLPAIDFDDVNDAAMVEVLQDYLNALIICPLFALACHALSSERGGYINFCDVIARYPKKRLVELVRGPTDASGVEIIATYLQSVDLVEIINGRLQIASPTAERFLRSLPTCCTTLSYSQFLCEFDYLLVASSEDRRPPLPAVNRSLNLFGSAFNTAGLLTEICSSEILPRFEPVDSDSMPLGIVDVGCGNGEPALAISKAIADKLPLGSQPFYLIGVDNCPNSLAQAEENFHACAPQLGVSHFALIRGDANDPASIISAIRERDIRLQEEAVDTRRLLFTQMFVSHQRRIRVPSVHDAKDIVRQRLSRIEGSLFLRELTNGVSWSRWKSQDEAEQLKLILDCMCTNLQDDGKIVEAITNCADYILYLERWNAEKTGGLLLVDLHIAQLEKLYEVSEETPLRKQLLTPDSGSFAPWVTHFISGQFPMSFHEHALCCALADFEPESGSYSGRGLVPKWGSGDNGSNIMDLDPRLVTLSYTTL